jgi:hypothetical protein
MSDDRKVLFSGAVQLKPDRQKNEHYGKTVGTLKLFENERFDGDYERHPSLTGYIIINLTDDKKKAQFYPVSVWNKQPTE